MPAATLSREAELRTALKTKTEEMNEGLNKGVKVDGANVEITTDDYAKLIKTRDEINSIKDLIGMEVLGIETKEWLEAPASDSVSVRQGAKVGGQELREIKSLGEMFLDSKEFKDMLETGGATSRQMMIEGVQDIGGVGQYGTKDVYSGITGSVPNSPRSFGTIQFDPMVPRPYRAFRVRDLFPAVATSATSIDYFRVLGYAGGTAGAINDGGNNAAMIADRTATNGTAGNDVFGLKPQTQMKYSSLQTGIKTIAHWEAAHRNVLDDMPQLRGTIDNELLYGLRLKEDAQILSGSGQGEDLLGILNTPHIQTYTQASTGTGATAAASEQMSDALRRAATKVVIAQYQSTGFVMHPNNWEDVELQKASGDGQYMLVTNIAIGAQTQVWRQPVVETVAIPENTFLTGAFGLGATLYDRQLANVRTAEQHADFFLRNAIVILVEERLGLAVKRPESFVKGTFFVAA